MKRAVNIFCLAGMILALVPITASWATADGSLPLGVDRHISAIDVMANRVTADCPCLVMSAVIFTVGTALLLVSPLGSTLQIVGIGILVLASPVRIYCGDAYCLWHCQAGIGLFVAAVAAALPLVGTVCPLGLVRELKLARLKDRFITFSAVA